jgi:serine/threonine protein kinase/tetratricopeptide (TPR) repeat protein
MSFHALNAVGSDLLDAFERRLRTDPSADLAEFLLAPDHPDHLVELTELARLDMEYARRRSAPRPPEHYFDAFPALRTDQTARAALAFEDYRLRKLGGESVTPAEYASRYGVSTTDWPTDSSAERDPPDPILSGRDDTPPPRLDPIRTSVLKRDAARPDVHDLPTNVFVPESSHAVSAEFPAMPEAGTRFLDFELIEELGRGAFGRVYLARQGDLAGRPVALKVARGLFAETQTLARLQHTNIVPIYSAHDAGGVQALCMPYFGRCTLAHALAEIRTRGGVPETGEQFVVTVRLGRTVTHPLTPTLTRDALTEPESGGAPDPEPVGAGTTCEQAWTNLTALSYPDAVVWIAAQLAAGLAHAHDRGIVHRDLKPANVLLTDDGVPMLLDFNIAEDTRADRRGPRVVGGTLPYMAPEQLRAYSQVSAEPIDGRADVYALGVVLFEMLTGLRPFPDRTGGTERAIDEMLADRRAGSPNVRIFNRLVSPAVAAVVAKCLAPDPSARYASARDLHEDLTRHLADLPLRYAPNRSVRERLGKWRRRHPRLASSGAIALLAGAFLVAPATVIAVRQNQLAERARQIETAEAELAARDSGREARSVQVLLATRGNRELLDRGLDRGRAVLARYGIGTDPDWRQRPLFARLSAEQQTELATELGEMALLMCRGERLRIADGSERALRQALFWNRLAEECYPAGRAPALLARQRGDLLAALPDETDRRPVPPTTPSAGDAYHDALALVSDGRYRDALAALKPFTERNPRNYQAWFLRGHCHDVQAQFADSDACWTACIALEPELPWAWFNRGVVRMQRQDPHGAGEDFTRALELQPDWTEARMNRAIARKTVRDYAGAREDVSAVIAGAGAPVRAWFLRAEIEQLDGKPAAAANDRAEGMKREPTDELSWSTRGYARMAREPNEALRDLDRALALNPASRDALLNKSIVLSEYLNRPREAVAVLDRFLTLYPDHVPARAGRGVVLARIGECKRARADAERIAPTERTPFIRYQLAGLYAQLSRHEKGPDARDEALRLLSRALRDGFTDLTVWKTDPDLDPIRTDPEFKRLLDVLSGLKSIGEP